MRELPLGTGPFTVDEALTAGWTHSALKNAVRHGRLRRLRRGVYLPVERARTSAETSDSADSADSDDEAAVLVAVAAARALPRVTVSHHSAALLHGLPLVGPRPTQPAVTIAPRSGANLAGVHPHRAQLRPEDVTERCGVAVTSVARTLIDLARHCATRTAVTAIDAGLHRELVTLEELQEVRAFCRTWPLVRRADRALRLCDGRAESPLESLSRLALPFLGVPAPQPQVPILDPAGRFVGRVDFYWDDAGVVGEADGRAKYDAREVLTAEKCRQEALEELGLVVVRWGWIEVTRRQGDLRERLRRAFERGRRRDVAGLPRLWTL